jgi:hypothetical protein
MVLSRLFKQAILTTAIGAAAMPVWAGDPPPSTVSRAVVSNSPTLQDSLNRLYARSASWRDAVRAIDAAGRKVVVVTPRQIKVKDPGSDKLRDFDPDVLAEVQPLAEHETRVDAVVVVVNLALLESWQSPMITPREFEDDIDRVLAHEVYGHAFPYLLAGDLSGKCADPVDGQRAQDACAIRRENVIRKELRLGQRREYGLYGLAVGRHFRQ